MRTRDKERLKRETTKMLEQSAERWRLVKKMPKDKIKKLAIPDRVLALPGLPTPPLAQEGLDWRKYKNTRRARPISRRKRIVVVESIVKKKEVYTINGLNASELDNVLKAIARK